MVQNSVTPMMMRHTEDYDCRKGSQTSPWTLADARVKKGEHV